MSDCYIGLMSGSSINAVDAVLCEFHPHSVSLIATHSLPIPSSIQAAIRDLTESGYDEIRRLCTLDRKIAKLFAQAAIELIDKTALSPSQIKAIGSHGQTIRHSPSGKEGYSLQIGDPNTIAAETGMTTIADFRRRDIALGGQGAPLACGFHEFLLRDGKENRVVLNIGGIANITVLPKNPGKNMTGFDTGPGNTLMDYVMRKHLQRDYDQGGEVARQGKIHEAFLHRLLSDEYFSRPFPKSTSTDYFSATWLDSKIPASISTPDMLATLAELTALTITQAIEKAFPEAESIWLCGGGAYNHFLRERLKKLNKNCQINDTTSVGIDAEWVEAAAFAWLAKQTLEKKPANCPSVTGANQMTVLGGVYYG